jgi:hypothetical protein
MARKTIDVQTVKEHINKALATVYVGNTPDYRRGLAAVLDDVLMTTGNYRGFRYLHDAAPLIDGQSDETRREYY